MHSSTAACWAYTRGTAGHQLYIKNFGGGQVSVTSVASDVYTQLTIGNINVVNGQAETGFWTSDAVGTGGCMSTTSLSTSNEVRTECLI